MKNNVFIKIIALCSVFALCASLFVVSASADASSLSPRSQMSPNFPLDELFFYDTASGIQSVISSPLSLFNTNTGTITDITRFPTGLSSSGTSVTTLVSYNWRHTIEGTANESPKRVQTDFVGENWYSLFGNSGSREFSAVKLSFSPFLCNIDPYSAFVIVSSDTVYIPPENVGVNVHYSYYEYTTDSREPILHVGDEFFGYDYDEISGNYYCIVPYQFVLPGNNTSYITNYSLDIVAGTRSGRRENLHNVEGFYMLNTFFNDSEIEARNANIPIGAKYVQVINDRNFTDLLDWLGDVMEGFLTTPLFTVGNLNISVGTIITTIFGLLFVFVFLRFFSGG